MAAEFNEAPLIEIFDETTYWSFINSGVSLVIDASNVIETVQLFSGADDKFKPFAGVLPCGLGFGDARRKVHKKLGKPKSQGGGVVIPGLGLILNWELFQTPEGSLHLEYCKGDLSINLVSLSA